MEQISPQDALQLLREKKSVKVYLPTQDKRLVPVEGTAQLVAANIVRVNFPPDNIPWNLNSSGSFKLSIDLAGPTVSLHGRIESIVNERQLTLKVLEAYELPQKRQFFRIDADLPVAYWVDQNGNMEEACEPLPAKSERVNLSGGGMLFAIDTPVTMGQKMGVELRLPGTVERVVRCKGTVVRVSDYGQSESLVAVKFTDIGEMDRERIMNFCFTEQRRQLRTKVEVAGGRR